MPILVMRALVAVSLGGRTRSCSSQMSRITKPSTGTDTPLLTPRDVNPAPPPAKKADSQASDAENNAAGLNRDGTRCVSGRQKRRTLIGPFRLPR